MKKLKKLNDFNIECNFFLDTNEISTLSLLYLPLIGGTSYSFYNLIYSISKANKSKYTISFIMDQLNLKLNDLNKSKDLLEGIGLLETYYNDKEEIIFCLRKPLSPNMFVKDTTLGLYLKNQIGDFNFNKILELLKLDTINKANYSNITKSFNEVFEVDLENITLDIKEQLLENNDTSRLKVDNEKFNYEVFKALISDSYKSIKLNRPTLKNKINSLSYTYKLNENDFMNIYMNCLDNDSIFDDTKLNKETEKYYQYLQSKKPNESTSNKVDKGTTEYHKLTPKDILSRNGSISVADSDLKAVEYVIDKSNLDKSVINVIIHYITSDNNKVLTKSYLDKLASELERKSITTVKDAKDYLYNSNNVKKNTSKTTYTRTKNVKLKEVDAPWAEKYKDKYK